MRYIYHLYAILLLISCSSLEPSRWIAPGKSFSLTNVKKIRPGLSSKKEILGILGEPSEQVNLSWSYLEEPFRAEDRISVEFSPSSEVVISVGWAVREGEPEQSLDVAKALFAGGKFETQNVPNLNPHTVETKVLYKEKKLGVIIVYEKLKRKVESISWMLPEELVKRTALDNFTYPEVCIQGHCSQSSPEIERKLSSDY